MQTERSFEKMTKNKKIKKARLLASVLMTSLFFGGTTSATEIEFENDIEYYLAICSKSTSDNKETCELFRQHLEEVNMEAERQLEELNKSKEELSDNILKYTQKISEYNDTIYVLQTQVNYYNERILQINNELSGSSLIIENFQNGVFDNELAVRKRILEEQMVAGTPILKSLSFQTNTLSESAEERSQKIQLMDYDLYYLNQINKELGELRYKQQATLSLLKEMEDAKNEVQALLMTTNEISDGVRDVLVEFRRQEADIISITNTTIEEIDTLRLQLKSVSTSLDAIGLSNYFIRPVNARISAGTWYYPASFGGGAHSGMDYAAKIGTPIYAPANGIIAYSSNGCDNNGYLGNRCGIGMKAAGNQTYLLTSVNGKLYAMSFYHMNADTNLPSGTVVKQGDKIGEIGNSGNTTGAHVHIEVAYLGERDIYEYLETWDGDLDFGAKHGASAIKTSCEKTDYKAPCKMKPELLFEEERG